MAARRKAAERGLPSPVPLAWSAPDRHSHTRIVLGEPMLPVDKSKHLPEQPLRSNRCSFFSAVILVCSTVAQLLVGSAASPGELASMVAQAASVVSADAATAERILRAAIAKYDHPVPLFNLGVLLLDQPGRVPEAAAVLKSALHFRPTHAPTLANAGVAFDMMGLRKQARQM